MQTDEETLERVLQNSGCPGNGLRHDRQQLACSSLVFMIGPAELGVMTRASKEMAWKRLACTRKTVLFRCNLLFMKYLKFKVTFFFFFFSFRGSGSSCCERRPNTPLMSLDVMPWPRPSARIIICTKPVWRLDLCYGEAPGTSAQLCGGSGTPPLSNFGVIRHVFPPQPFYLSRSGGGFPRPGQALAS